MQRLSLPASSSTLATAKRTPQPSPSPNKKQRGASFTFGNTPVKRTPHSPFVSAATFRALTNTDAPEPLDRKISFGSISKDAEDEDGRTLLHHAAANNRPRIVQLLLEKHGFNPNHLGAGYCPLHYAVTHGTTEVSRLLLEHGADVNGMDRDKATPLHWACHYGFLPQVELLIASKAHVNALDGFGTNPIGRAEETHHVGVANFLATYNHRLYAPQELDSSAAAEVEKRFALVPRLKHGVQRYAHDGYEGFLVMQEVGVDPSCLLFVDSASIRGVRPSHRAAHMHHSAVAQHARHRLYHEVLPFDDIASIHKDNRSQYLLRFSLKSGGQRVLLCSEREELLSVVGHALHGAGTHVVPPALQEDLPDDALSLPPQAEETTDKQPSSGGAARGASDALSSQSPRNRSGSGRSIRSFSVSVANLQQARAAGLPFASDQGGASKDDAVAEVKTAADSKNSPAKEPIAAKASDVLFGTRRAKGKNKSQQKILDRMGVNEKHIRQASFDGRQFDKQGQAVPETDMKTSEIKLQGLENIEENANSPRSPRDDGVAIVDEWRPGNAGKLKKKVRTGLCCSRWNVRYFKFTRNCELLWAKGPDEPLGQWRKVMVVKLEPPQATDDGLDITFVTDLPMDNGKLTVMCDNDNLKLEWLTYVKRALELKAERTQREARSFARPSQ